MMQPVKIALFGAAGRMGREIVSALRDASDLQLESAVGRPESEAIGQDAGGVTGGPPLGISISGDVVAAAGSADVMIDYSSPSGFPTALSACRAARCAFVSGTTGLNDSHRAALREAGDDIPILHASNMTFGMAVLNRLVGEAAAMLGDDFDAEIVEMHHRHKKDAPSGSALKLGETIAAARGTTLDQCAAFARHGAAVREPGSIGFASLRGGDVAGDHTAIFAGEGERIELSFRAGSRRVFANGALRAARWLVDRPAGLYGIDDMLGRL
jgi:4-hydroxy-tetrahydrodipicolinate reductase